MGIKKYYIILALIGLMYGCQKQTYSYYDYDDAMYVYSKGKNEKKDAKKILKSYQKIITKQKGKVKKVPPGSCIDYGCLLLSKGDTLQAKEYFDKEMLLYPESRTYIESLKRKLGL
jgi:hypothetical protein